ncbi:MAG: LuxR C-terminal-related transcriptional regulator [Sporichthyaceae bacterium]
MPERNSASVRDLLEQVRAAGVGASPPPGPLDSPRAQALLLSAWDATRDRLTDCLADPERLAQAQALLGLLGELRKLSDALRDEQWLERERTFERVRETLALLRDVGSSAELVDAAVVAICELGFDRAIVSRVENDLWIAESVYVGRDVRWAEEILQASRSNPQILGDGLVEAEVVRTGRSVLVASIEDLPTVAVNRPIADTSLSRGYVAAPIVAHGSVVGFLHADCYYQGRELGETDRAILALFGEGLGYALARTAVLDRLSALRDDLGRIGGVRPSLAWPDGSAQRILPPEPAGDGGLTRREIEVLQWMARGDTNARIARRLSITEGTVKTHVQAILRKLGAANRAEAVSRWAHLQGPTRR